MTAKTAGIREISLVVIPTIDQDGAIEFYESIGFEKRTDIPFGGKYRWVEVHPPQGTTGIALAPPPPGKDAEAMQTGITLAQMALRRRHAGFKAEGIDVRLGGVAHGPPRSPMFWFRDLGGHSLLVVEST